MARQTLNTLRTARARRTWLNHLDHGSLGNLLDDDRPTRLLDDNEISHG